MKHLKLIYLILVLPLATLVAQGEQTKTKTKYIIKKVTVENIDGKETQKEEIDTVDFMSMDPSMDKNIQVIVKDAKGNTLSDGEAHEMMFQGMPQMENQMEWHEMEIDKNATPPNKAVLGVQLENVNGENGAQVIEVFEGSAAEKAGILEGDIILSIEGKETKSVDAVIEQLSDNKPGDKVKVSVLRGTKVKNLNAKLQERKAETISMKSCGPGMAKMKCCKSGNGNSGESRCIIIKKDKDGKEIMEEIKGIPGFGENQNKTIIIRDGDKDIKIIHGDGESKNVEISKRGDGEVKEQVIRSEKQQSLNVEYLTSSPNPSNGQMKINFSGLKVPTVIQVLDLNGKEVYSEKLDEFDGSYNKEIDIKNEAKGTLILKIKQGDKVITQKIIVE